LDGEPMTEVCRAFGISRKTGYKIFDRYKEHGLEALTDRSRRPIRSANQLPGPIESLSPASRTSRTGARARSASSSSGGWMAISAFQPRARSKSTIHAVLHRHGLVRVPGRPRHPPPERRSRPGRRRTTFGAPTSRASSSSATGNTVALTVTDHASRFLLLCEALESTREDLAVTAFEQLFRERGLPQAIRSDNGVPFASPNGLFNLSRLAVWWLRLGIAIERIKPGRPSRTAATSACTSPSSRRRPARPA